MAAVQVSTTPVRGAAIYPALAVAFDLDRYNAPRGADPLRDLGPQADVLAPA